jgi:hypothetical protein
MTMLDHTSGRFSIEPNFRKDKGDYINYRKSAGERRWSVVSYFNARKIVIRRE